MKNNKNHNSIYSFRTKNNLNAFREGIKDGVPIGLGYLAVSFSLGVMAKKAGLTPFQGFLASLLCSASAGEYAGFTVIAAGASILEMILATLVANARYLLMSCSLSQRMDPDVPKRHRFLMAIHVTDELFGIAIARPGYLNPWYSYGAVLTAAPPWAIGTALGVIAGNLLSVRLVSAFSVALYGMFLAVIIPPARTSRVLAVLIPICFAASFAASRIPGLASIPEGTRTIVLTVLIAGIAAILFPKTPDSEVTNDTE